MCKLEDLDPKPNANTKRYFKTWDGFTILCPDVPEGFDFKLYGEAYNTTSGHINIRVQKCIGKANCKNETEINEWVKDIEVSTWFIYDKIDFLKLA